MQLKFFRIILILLLIHTLSVKIFTRGIPNFQSKHIMIYNLINVFTDGGARGNPGDAGIGVYVTDKNKKQLAGFGNKIGFATNNVAEYKAVISALDWIIENKKNLSKSAKINFFLDSNLVCSQIIGIFKVKDANLRNLLFDVRTREGQINFPIYYKHIPREQNTKADSFVNFALDQVEPD